MHCHGILQTEISLIKPKLILGLGRSAAHSLFGFSVPLSSYRGMITKTVDDTPCVITHHPARLLREKDPSKIYQFKKEFRQDIQLALRNLNSTNELVV
jgi:DNA polymerase